MKLVSRSMAGASLVAIAAFCSAVSVHAQTESAAASTGSDTKKSDDTVVVVTGLRKSLATAEAIKRNADQFVDSITAQDIGKFPDTDIAESLQRVSGIQIQRNLGDGSVVAIRGLTQIRTELNGHDIFTADGGTTISFEDIGPDLLSRVDVYKNPAADLIEGSLAGTIDMRTRMPFDSKQRLLSFSASDTDYDLAKKNGQSFSALYSDRWHTGFGDVGVLLNAAYQRSYYQQQIDQVDPYWYHGVDASGHSYTLPNGAQTLTTTVPGYANQTIAVEQGGGFNIGAGDRTRRSVNAAVQWKPNDDMEFYAQVFDNAYDFHDVGLSFFATDSGAAPVGTYTVSNGIATSGSLAGPGGTAITYFGNRHSRTNDYAAGMKWNLNSRTHFDFDAQYVSSTVQTQSMDEFLSLINKDSNGNALYDLNFDNRGKFPTMASSVPGYFANPANYNFEALYYQPSSNKANEVAVKSDLVWDFDDDKLLRKVTAGVRYSKKYAINATHGNWASLPSPCVGATSGCPLSLAPSYVELNPYQSNLLRGDAANSVFGSVYEWKLADAAHPQNAFNDFYTLSGQRLTWPCLSADPSCGASYSHVNEVDTAAYIKADLGGSFPGWVLNGYDVNWDGNLGLRYYNTEESGIGYEQLSYHDSAGNQVNDIQPYVGGSKYNGFLPTFNMRVKLSPDLLARFAVSKNIYRPGFNQLNPSFNLSPTYVTGSTTQIQTVNGGAYDATTNPYLGSGSVNGNPNLKPERVTSFDASLEWYFSKDGYAFITVFDKDIRDLIDNETYSVVRAVPTVGNVQFNVTSLENKAKGTAKGFELGGQRFFDFLPGAWSGLGVAANYTYVDSDAGTVANATVNATSSFKVPLIDLSKNSYNLMMLYDKYGWNARIAYNWRSKFLDSTSETGVQNVPIYFAAYGVLDASLSYDVNDNLSFTLDGQNLNDHVEKSYQGQPDLLRNYQINDRRVSLRMRVKY